MSDESDRYAADEPVVATLRSNWQEFGVMLPVVGRLLRDLATDARLPWRAKLAGVDR